MKERSVDPGMGRIITRLDGTIPLPPDYRTDLPDNDPINHDAYVTFHNRIGRLMKDDQIGPWAKIVMTQYFIHGEHTSDLKMCKICELSHEQLQHIKDELMYHDWLASPEG